VNKTLPSVDKIKLFKRVEAGEAVTDVCREAKISRFTYYKWYKRWKLENCEKSLEDRRFNPEKHWKKASQRRELAIKEVVSGHPEWSSHKIADFLGHKGLAVSNHGVQGILERLGLNILEKRVSYQEKERVFVPKTKIENFTPEEKIKILSLHQENGEEISSICRKYGMSRYTFYKWLKRYQENPQNWQENLLSQKPKGEKHWRFLSFDKQQLVLSIVVEHPEFSVHKIYSLLKGQIGHHGIQHVFERNNLNLVNLRFAYAQNQPKVEKISAVSLWFNKLKTVWESFSPSLAPAPPPPLRSALQNFVGAQPLLKPFFISFFSTTVFLLALLNWISIFSSHNLGAQIGLFFASVSLATGTIFFAYSMKYYLSLALVLSFSSRESGSPSSANGRTTEGKGWLERIFGVSGNNQPSYAKATEGKSGLQANLDHIKLERFPFISIHLPFYNEKKVANRIISACTSMDYPNFEVIVCDDSNDETVDIVNEWKNHPRVRILHRPTREGFKGGALSYALKAMDTRTEFVCVFDADFVPYPDSLMQFMKYFKSTGSWSEDRDFNAADIRTMPYSTFGEVPQESRVPQVSQAFYSRGTRDTSPSRDTFTRQEEELRAKGTTAVVAGYQWHVLNKSENWITRGVRTEYSGSYVVERPAQEITGAMKIIHGSVYCMRADVLKHFGWGTSITEDYELTLRIYEKGFKVCYTPYIQAPSECVSTIKRLIRQRMRWAEGHSFNTRKMMGKLMFGSWKTEDGGLMTDDGRQMTEDRLKTTEDGRPIICFRFSVFCLQFPESVFCFQSSVFKGMDSKSVDACRKS
jgi:glycosyltransferase involved in cell wall biosynthesis/transposase-like protein